MLETAVPAPSITPPSASGLVPGWIGARAYDAEGARIGHIADVLFTDRDRMPGWLVLALPRTERRYVLAPAGGLGHRFDGVRLACPRELVRTAPPSASPPDALTARHAAVLAAHYGVRCGPGPWQGVVEPSLAGSGGRMRAGRPV
ncbi:MAG: PRC-barrel domain-containing protein [Solirubrobacterales bacterium]|nr:PRC-barrel domain-containing protein [Solirubrobacterales bacterium]